MTRFLLVLFVYYVAWFSTIRIRWSWKTAPALRIFEPVVGAVEPLVVPFMMLIGTGVKYDR